jgi:hypothetical protein
VARFVRFSFIGYVIDRSLKLWERGLCESLVSYHIYCVERLMVCDDRDRRDFLSADSDCSSWGIQQIVTKHGTCEAFFILGFSLPASRYHHLV